MFVAREIAIAGMGATGRQRQNYRCRSLTAKKRFCRKSGPISGVEPANVSALAQRVRTPIFLRGGFWTLRRVALDILKRALQFDQSFWISGAMRVQLRIEIFNRDLLLQSAMIDFERLVYTPVNDPDLRTDLGRDSTHGLAVEQQSEPLQLLRIELYFETGFLAAVRGLLIMHPAVGKELQVLRA